MGLAAAALETPTTANTAKGAGAANIFECCEATFNIDIGPHEAQSAHTVGDLYDLIRWKCQSERLGASACSVADSYLALKSYLVERGLTAGCARPTAMLEVIFRTNTRAEWAQLRARFGKAIPGLTLSEGETVAMSMVLALGLAGGVFGGLYVSDFTHGIGPGLAAGLGIITTGFALVFAYGALFARTIPAELQTLADLARIATPNSSRVWRPAPRKPAEMWEALSDIVRREMGMTGPVSPGSAVGPAHGVAKP
jgi:hypothetical protein